MGTMFKEGMISRQYTVPDRDVDVAKRLKMSALFGYLQDIARAHSERLGLGIDILKNVHGVAWVLVRIGIEIMQPPRLDDEITIETWPHEPALLYDRDFRILDAAGKVMVTAASTWILMDLGKREIRKGHPMNYSGIDFVHDRALSRKPYKLHALKNWDAYTDKSVAYSDLDYNSHVNNARYPDFLMDCMDTDYHRGHPLKEIDVNYVSEMHPGETLRLLTDRRTASEGVVSVEGVVLDEAGENGRTAMRGRLLFA